VGTGNSIIEINQAQSADDIEQARELFREYAAWVEIDLCFQNFENEVRELPGNYVPPDGRLLLASHNGQLAGCIAMRRIGEGVCEMKRLFVRDAFRGQGLGRNLIEFLIRAATELGYERMRLDTLPPKMNDAIKLYRLCGFKEIEPYYDNPVPGATFMELTLKQT